MEHRKVSEECFQYVTFARSPVRIQRTLAHLRQSHERKNQLGTADDSHVLRRELGVPLEDKTGYVCVNDQSCRCKSEETSMWRCS